MASIDLRKAIGVEDDQDPEIASKRRDVDDYDAMYGVERSFRLVFPNNQEITFFADTDEEKIRWCVSSRRVHRVLSNCSLSTRINVLRQMIGHIPCHALWAELLWQRKKSNLRTGYQSQPSSDVPSS